MPRQLHLFDKPTRFVVGTVGQPGDRTFYLQATDGARTVSVVLEKQQVAVLADRVDEILDEAARRGGEDIPEVADSDDLDPLELPLDEEFRVGAMGLAWDAEAGVVVVEAVAAGEAELDEDAIFSESDTAPDALRVRLAPEQARAFAVRARSVVGAGRPQCPLCALPLEPTGHICPRQNGYRRSEAT